MAKKKPARKDRRKPQKKPSRFQWNAQREQAAQLLAEDDFTDAEIAEKVGIAVRQIYEWKLRPEFTARIKDIVAQLGNISLRRVIARRNRRLLALEERWKLLQRVIEARAQDPDLQQAAGGGTGLLVRQQKILGSGDNAMLVEVFKVDIALLKELRETEKQAAQECGDWSEKHEHTGKDGAPIRLSLEDALAADRELEEWQAAQGKPGSSDTESCPQQQP